MTDTLYIVVGFCNGVIIPSLTICPEFIIENWRFDYKWLLVDLYESSFKNEEEFRSLYKRLLELIYPYRNYYSYTDKDNKLNRDWVYNWLKCNGALHISYQEILDEKGYLLPITNIETEISTTTIEEEINPQPPKTMYNDSTVDEIISLLTDGDLKKRKLDSDYNRIETIVVSPTPNMVAISKIPPKIPRHKGIVPQPQLVSLGQNHSPFKEEENPLKTKSVTEVITLEDTDDIPRSIDLTCNGAEDQLNITRDRRGLAEKIQKRRKVIEQNCQFFRKLWEDVFVNCFEYRLDAFTVTCY